MSGLDSKHSPFETLAAVTNSFIVADMINRYGKMVVEQTRIRVESCALASRVVLVRLNVVAARLAATRATMASSDAFTS